MAFYRLVHREKGFVLCVDPKCGCTTIKTWFADMFDEPLDPHDLPPAYIVDRTELLESDLTKVWFVRDPFRRLVSFYYQFVVRQPDKGWCFADHDRRVPLDDETFEGFILTMRGLHLVGSTFQHHLQPQTRFLSPSLVDVVVKIEELDERAEELQRLLSVGAAPGHGNRQDDGAGAIRPDAHLAPASDLARERTLDYASFWTDELRAMAAEVYAADLEMYTSL